MDIDVPVLFSNPGSGAVLLAWTSVQIREVKGSQTSLVWTNDLRPVFGTVVARRTYIAEQGKCYASVEDRFAQMAPALHRTAAARTPDKLGLFINVMRVKGPYHGHAVDYRPATSRDIQSPQFAQAVFETRRRARNMLIVDSDLYMGTIGPSYAILKDGDAWISEFLDQQNHNFVAHLETHATQLVPLHELKATKATLVAMAGADRVNVGPDQDVEFSLDGIRTNSLGYTVERVARRFADLHGRRRLSDSTPELVAATAALRDRLTALYADWPIPPVRPGSWPHDDDPTEIKADAVLIDILLDVARMRDHPSLTANATDALEFLEARVAALAPKTAAVMSPQDDDALTDLGMSL